MHETAATPLAGLFSPSEANLIYDAYRCVLITMMDRVDPRVEIFNTVSDSIDFSQLDVKWGVNRYGLLGKIQSLDAWEARFALRAIHALRKLTKELEVEYALVEVGLLRQGSRSVIRYTCGHDEDTDFRCDGEVPDRETYTADLPCPSCRLRERIAVDQDSGYAALSGDTRRTLAAAEGRARLILALEGAVSDKSRERAFRDVVVRYLKGISNPLWWWVRRDHHPKAIVDEVATMAIQSVAREGELKQLLLALNPGIRKAAILALPRAVAEAARPRAS